MLPFQEFGRGADTVHRRVSVRDPRAAVGILELRTPPLRQQVELQTPPPPSQRVSWLHSAVTLETHHGLHPISALTHTLFGIVSYQCKGGSSQTGCRPLPQTLHPGCYRGTSCTRREREHGGWVSVHGKGHPRANA